MICHSETRRDIHIQLFTAQGKEKRKPTIKLMLCMHNYMKCTYKLIFSTNSFNKCQALKALKVSSNQEQNSLNSLLNSFNKEADFQLKKIAVTRNAINLEGIAQKLLLYGTIQVHNEILSAFNFCC